MKKSNNKKCYLLCVHSPFIHSLLLHMLYILLAEVLPSSHVNGLSDFVLRHHTDSLYINLNSLLGLLCLVWLCGHKQLIL